MKKSNKRIFSILFSLFIMFCFLEVKALDHTLTMQKEDGIYYTRVGGGLTYVSNPFSFYLIDGEIVYCVEPGVEILTYNYEMVDSFDELNYSKEIKELIRLIGYYGYEYKEHQTVRYAMATQALIWEKIKGCTVEFYTERYGYGNYIDISFEKNEIMKLVNFHLIKPSFENINLNSYLNKEVILDDNNKVLENFEIYETNSNEVSILGNILHIIPKKIGKSEIILKKKVIDNKKTTLFVPIDGKSQKVAKLRVDDIFIKINLETKAGKIKLQKLDFDKKTNIPSGSASLEGAIYEIYDINNNLITSLTTNKEGYAESDCLPYLGDYKIKEIKASLGYELDLETYTVTIDENNLEVNFSVYEKVIKQKVKVEKIDLETEEKILLSGIVFKVKDLKTNKYVCYENNCFFKTDLNGEFIIPNLIFGDYQLEEVEQDILGYTWNKEVLKFSIISQELYQDETKENILVLKFYNKPVKGKIEIKKIGEKIHVENGTYNYEKINLKDVKFHLLAKEDIYSNKKLKYKKDDLVSELITDENGLALVNNLYLGSYYLKEVNSNNGNLVNNDIIAFDLKYQDSYTNEVIKVFNIENYLPKGSIEILKVDSYTNLPLSNALIEIYNQEKEKIYQGYTNEFGKINLTDVLIGNYSLKEIESPDGYYIGNEDYFLTVSNKEKANLIIKNNPIQEIEVPNTFLNDLKTTKQIGIIILFVLIGLLIYKRKIFLEKF